jgi:serine/threonine protein kinase/tetratricopeptide (TPR) repeat protein
MRTAAATRIDENEADFIPIPALELVGLMPFRKGARLGNYEVLQLLAKGGTGEVYQARDRRLDRMVALKALRAEQLSDSRRRRRFEREARAVSALNHPNIVTIYDVVEDKGRFYLIMEYIRGATLKELLGKGSLPIEEAIRMALGIADALAAAHDAGIVHRDLKPANIMITIDGRVKVLDFGLAKIEQQLGVDGHTQTLDTEPRTLTGTASYMSPEQSQGQPVDFRTDVFSFGLVLYEMLTGEVAFPGDRWMTVLTAIARDEPRPLRELRPDAPVNAERIVQRCLRKLPAERFQTMAKVRQALASGEELPAIEYGPPSIAVLPFANLSGDPENDYFGDGLAEELINALTRIAGLKVIARTSSFPFRGTALDLQAVGKRLGVATILQGSIRKSADRIWVAAQLIRAADQTQVWSGTYDRELTGIFGIHDDIAQAMAEAFNLRFSAARHPTMSVEAWQSYLKGMYHFQRFTADGVSKGMQFLEEALCFDPSFARAYAGKAVLYQTLGTLGMRRMADMGPLATAAAEKALAIDPTLIAAHTALGVVKGLEFQWNEAARHFQIALDEEGLPPMLRTRYALYLLMPTGRFGEALTECQRALETDPLSMLPHFALTYLYYWRRDFAGVKKVAANSLDISPGFWLVRLVLAMAEFQMGELDEAIRDARLVLQSAPFYSIAGGLLAAAQTRAGRRKEAEAVIAQFRNANHYVLPSCFAIYHAGNGDADAMFAAYDQIIADHDPHGRPLAVDPLMDPYRKDPRFNDVLRHMNLHWSGGSSASMA